MTRTITSPAKRLFAVAVCIPLLRSVSSVTRLLLLVMFDGRRRSGRGLELGDEPLGARKMGCERPEAREDVTDGVDVIRVEVDDLRRAKRKFVERGKRS